MLSARDLTLRRGPEPLFEQVNFTIFRGNKVGLTGVNGVNGVNGAGKSSLLKMRQPPRDALAQDAASLEARWIEVGTTLEAAQAKEADDR